MTAIWSVALSWHLALAFFALGFAFAQFPISANFVAVSGLTLAFAPLFLIFFKKLPLTVHRLRRSGFIALVALIFFFDFENGFWVSTGGADSGNHWMIYWSLLRGDRGAYEGFTAFHWGVRWWRELFPALTGVSAVALTQLLSSWLCLSFFALGFLRHPHWVGYLTFVSAAASLRVLVGDGYYSQSFSWAILAFIWLSVSVSARTRAPRWFELFGWGGLILSLRGIYGGDLPLVLTVLGLWIASAKPFVWWRLAGGAIYGGAGIYGLYLLGKIMASGGGILKYGTQEAFVLLVAGAALAWIATRRQKILDPAQRFWRLYLGISAVYFVVIFAQLRSMEYYFIKLLLFPSIIGLGGWLPQLRMLRGRIRAWSLGAWTLAWALIFQRYAVLMFLWFLFSFKPTDALMGPSIESRLSAIVANRNCESYLYVTEDWARYNWANHVLHGNPRVIASLQSYLDSVEITPSFVRPECVFVERNTDRKVRQPRIQPNWECFDSGIQSVGEICAAPQN